MWQIDRMWDVTLLVVVSLLTRISLSKSPTKWFQFLKYISELIIPPFAGLPYLLMKKSYCDAFTLHCESALSNKRGDKYLNVPDAKDVDLLKEDPRKDLDETWCRIFKFQPLWKIRNYFGERIAFYFAWSGMLITSLWIPTLFGLCVFFYGLYERWAKAI